MRTLDAQPVEFPSAEEYVKGFEAIRETITVNQLLLLQRHYNSPGRTTTATKLAQSVGYATHNGFNSQYGKLASRLGEAMQLEVLPDRVQLLTIIAHDPAVENNECQFVMRPQVAAALERMGWVW